MGRFGELSEVAKMVLVAAAPESSYMTGSSLLVDGGWAAYGYL
jgi:NAD(P)-dependent dehydrogenase (short-subunit alcohol dehydrogenase family)